MSTDSTSSPPAPKSTAVASAPPPLAQSAAVQTGFSREIRFAVVMYGGISLSVYINGVAQELFRMVRATAPRDGDPLTGDFAFDVANLTGSERIYRKVAAELRAR